MVVRAIVKVVAQTRRDHAEVAIAREGEVVDHVEHGVADLPARESGVVVRPLPRRAPPVDGHVPRVDLAVYADGASGNFGDRTGSSSCAHTFDTHARGI